MKPISSFYTFFIVHSFLVIDIVNRRHFLMTVLKMHCTNCKSFRNSLSVQHQTSILVSMAGMDDNVAIIGDWVPPSPSPRTFLSAMLGDDMGSRPASEPPGSKRTEELFLGPPLPNTNFNNTGIQGGVSGHKFCDLGSFSDHKSSSSRGGLVERMAARAGFNAPRLNTQGIRSADLSSNSEIRSPYLTIPPGLSPTTLLDSPVFLSNSLVISLSLSLPSPSLNHVLPPFVLILYGI